MRTLSKETKFLNFFKIYAVSCSILLFAVYIFLNTNYINIDHSVIALFTLIVLIVYLKLVSNFKEYPYSLTMMHYLFILMFYGIAAYTQYLNNRFVYGLVVDPQSLIYILIITLLWLAFFFLGSVIGKRIKGNFSLSSYLMKSIDLNYSFIVFCTILSVCIAAYTLSQTGVEALLSRSTGDNSYAMDSKGGSLIVTAFFRNTVVYGIAIAILFHQRSSKIWILLAVQFICCLIINSPLAMSRYNVAIVYLGILLLMFPKVRKNFILLFIVAFVFLFPMFNLFRRMNVMEVTPEMLMGSFTGMSENFLSGDFDAFSMIISTFRHVGEYGVSYGYQFLGAFFFFVPRSIWVNKPVGSGSLVREAQGETFVNVSSPLIAESMINFGVLGVVLVALILGISTARIDRLYWKEIKANASAVSYLQILYPFLLPMFFFMNRGDLLSTFAFSISHIAIFTLMFWLNNAFFAKLRAS